MKLFLICIKILGKKIACLRIKITKKMRENAKIIFKDYFKLFL